MKRTGTPTVLPPATKNPRHQITDDGDVNEETSFLDLIPEIILLIILMKLPVETLSMLKCVNRYLSRLISAPEFIQEHLELSTQDASMSRYKLMFCMYPNPILKQIPISSLCQQDSPLNVFDIDYPTCVSRRRPQLGQVVNLVGSFNGLVAIIFNYEFFFIWNPAIRKHVKLPTIVGQEELGGDGIDFFCGFGFDATNDDYKVIALFETERPYGRQSDISYAVYVYSLKKNSWTRIPGFKGDQFVGKAAMFAYGKLHLRSVRGDIISFDVEKEVFGMLEQPNYEHVGCHSSLFVMGGYVTVCHVNLMGLDVWVMKDYGIKSSWTKMYNVSELCWPFFILPSGAVLRDNGVFFIYNPRDESRRYIEIGRCTNPVMYVESLISPCCNGRQEQN